MELMLFWQYWKQDQAFGLYLVVQKGLLSQFSDNDDMAIIFESQEHKENKTLWLQRCINTCM